MSKITKKVDRAIPPNQRTQTFAFVDGISEGDVLMVADSLGHPAKIVEIESTGGMQVRLNVYHTIYPRRDGNDLMFTSQMPNLALGQEIKTTSNARIYIDAGSTLTLDDGLPISDIELLTVTGNFSILTY